MKFGQEKRRIKSNVIATQLITIGTSSILKASEIHVIEANIKDRAIKDI